MIMLLGVGNIKREILFQVTEGRNTFHFILFPHTFQASPQGQCPIVSFVIL